MNSIFDKTLRGLNFAASGVVNGLNWRDYGFTPTDEKGNKKYRGFLIGEYPSGGEVVLVPSGHLDKPDESTQTLMRKFGILTRNPTFGASLLGRDPERGLWGGAIRSTSDDSVYIGMTGCPEIVDHLLVACVMFECHVLSETAFNALVSEAYLRSVRAARHMTVEQFTALRTWIRNMAKARCADL